ncbi:hypothetical protein [Prochlorococcus marinus]|nr:hypothetical protein [Prochlorococcus marinus]
MSNLKEFVPILIGLPIGWFVLLGARELFKEASVVMKRSNA